MPNPLSRVDAWLYHLGDIDAARASKIARTNADLVVTEFASYAEDEAPYDAALLERMRGGDDDRLIVSYLSIGEAEDYRFYWRDGWKDSQPSWLDAANPEWEGNIKVRFWDPAWQKIVFDYAERIVAAGFNGLYLDIIEAYEYWEEEAPGPNYRKLMADFVADLREVTDAKLADIGDADRDFVIIGQNGAALIREKAYLDAIDGIGKEDLGFYYRNGRPGDLRQQPDDEFDYAFDLLKQAEAAGKQVFAVEYLPGGTAASHRAALHAEAVKLEKAGIPLYVASSRDLDSADAQPRAVDVPGAESLALGRNLRGDNGRDVLRGDDGRDVMHGRGGDDVLRGRAGDDVLRGGAGDDVLRGGAGDDVLRGGGGDDVLRGGLGDDRLAGGVGDDRLIGAGGADALRGGAGSDVARGGAGADRLWGHGGGDVLFGGGGGDQMRGGGGADDLRGGGGGDRIWGGGGADSIEGGAGRDVMTGGADHDVFVFRAPFGHDEITDFDAARDHLAASADWSAALNDQADGLLVTYRTAAGLVAGTVFLDNVAEADLEPFVFYDL